MVRRFGWRCRPVALSTCLEFLQRQFNLPMDALYRAPGPVNLVRLNQLIDQVDAPALRFERYNAGWPTQLVPGQSYFERLREGDVLIHQPYESFDAVLAFLREAVEDPNVLAIKQTIYRTGAKSQLMELLREAVRRGKEVTAVVELKARFDEEANISYAERLESVGAQVVYGVVGLKTHAKMLLITRREDGRLKRYAHLSTGNYNPGTAKLYTDMSYLTADDALTSDLEQVFLHLASQNRLPKLNKVLLAPFHLHKAMMEKVDMVAAAARAGKPARIILKMNALTDEPMCRALAHASQQGVKIDLIVRGACILPAQLPGVTDNVRVRSIIGRLLEHSRVFYFQADERRRGLAVQCRLDEPQHAAPRGAGLAGDRSGAAPAGDRRVPDGEPERHAGCLGAVARWALRGGEQQSRCKGARQTGVWADHPDGTPRQQGLGRPLWI